MHTDKEGWRHNSRPIFPWYKERLQTKYPTALTSRISLVSSCRFANVNLDDFSDCSSVISGAQTGVSPLIFHGTPNQHISDQKTRKCISKEHACFSKQMVQTQIRKEYVAAVEKNLTQHPLVMYPHYKDHMTPELFDKVVSVLDPDMCVNSACGLPLPTGHHVEEGEEENGTEPSREEVDGAREDKISSNVQNPNPRNPYVLQMNRNGVMKSQKVEVKPPRAHEDIKAAAKLFSKWFACPDEETDITESVTLGSLDSVPPDYSSPTFCIQEEKSLILSAHK